MGKVARDAILDDPVVVGHSMRFRRVANRYPRQVAFAYGGDIAAASFDDDVTVAQTVAAWEREQGLESRDWYAIGRAERRDDDDVA